MNYMQLLSEKNIMENTDYPHNDISDSAHEERGAFFYAALILLNCISRYARLFFL